jgi:N-acyl-D-amino-acid deacylase
MSDVLQGVTLEVFGEGWSPGPRKRKPGDPGWTTLGGYFDHLQKKGISPNVASFVGATTVRAYVMGYENRKPTPTELQQMKNLVKSAMQEGAMGVGSSLIYTPATFADTDELIALCKVAADHGGMYITHMRSESDDILKAIDETIQIARQADIPAEIYHIKINQQRNWPKIDPVLSKIDSARKAGLSITANFYPYTASATGLKERIPNWAQEGGVKALRGRIRNPQTRTKILYDMEHGIPSRNSDPADVMLLGFSKDSLQQLYAGKRLDEVARLHGKNADETVLDIISRDPSASAIYFLMSEDNSTRFLQQPYVSIGIARQSGVGERELTYINSLDQLLTNSEQFWKNKPQSLQSKEIAKHIIELATLEQDNLTAQAQERMSALMTGHETMYDEHPEWREDLDRKAQAILKTYAPSSKGKEYINAPSKKKTAVVKVNSPEPDYSKMSDDELSQIYNTKFGGGQ